MKQPNIMLILVDDMGYSDLGCYGGEIETPNLNSLAENGIRFSNFYNTPKCSPSRASLLTGLYPSQVGMGILAHSGQQHCPEPPDGYAGNLPKNCVTIAEVLKNAGYGTYISGKWHLSNSIREEDDTWPRARGFDHHYGNINGATSYYYPATMFRDGESVDEEALNDPDFYYTDKIADQACKFINMHHEKHVEDKPFFMYVAFNAPHWPLHAKEADIAKYKGRFDEGWDILRERRLERLKEMGILDENISLHQPGFNVPPFEDIDEEDRAWLLRRMEVYAAMIDCVDQGIGRIIETLKENGVFEDTLLVFMSDNGASPEEIGDSHKFWIKTGVTRPSCRDGTPIHYGCNDEIMPGAENTWQSLGQIWATLSDTPFRGYKDDVFEGGISTPLIVHYPNQIGDKGGIRKDVAQLNDIMPTLLEFAGVQYPTEFNGNHILPTEGKSLVSSLKENTLIQKDALYWEHRDSQAIREGDWKIVRERGTHNWQLYNIQKDRAEASDNASDQPEKVEHLSKKWEKWAQMCHIRPIHEVWEIIHKYDPDK